MNKTEHPEDRFKPSREEADLLDAAEKEYERDGNKGRPFEEVFAELRKKTT